MNKIAIVGSGGSGKTTLSVKLSSLLNIPVYHLDIFFWKPNWEMVESPEWYGKNEEIVRKEKWIIDGNYKSTMTPRFEAADTIIYLDIPRIKCLYNAWKRYFKYHKRTRPDLAEGCFEKIDFEYYKWIWIYPKKFKPITLNNIELFGKSKNVFILKNKKEIEEFLKNYCFKPLMVLQP